MRPLVLLLIVTGSAASVSAQTQKSDETLEYEQRIQKLEERVAFLERALTEVLARNPQAPVLAEAPASARVASTPVRTSGYEPPPELVPEIGKIGAQVGLLLGASGSPFRLGSGSLTGGYIDLPLIDRPAWLHGKLSYEISIGMTQSRTTFDTTSNVAQVANLAVLNTLNPTGGLANITAAVTGTRSRAISCDHLYADPFAAATGESLRDQILDHGTRPLALTSVRRGGIRGLCDDSQPESSAR